MIIQGSFIGKDILRIIIGMDLCRDARLTILGLPWSVETNRYLGTLKDRANPKREARRSMLAGEEVGKMCKKR